MGIRIKGVCLRTWQEQIDGGDDTAIEPAYVNIPQGEIPVLSNFLPKPVLGWATVTLEDDRLICTAELVPEAEPYLSMGKLAIGYFARSDTNTVDLTNVSLVRDNADQGIPPYTVVPTTG